MAQDTLLHPVLIPGWSTGTVCRRITGVVVFYFYKCTSEQLEKCRYFGCEYLSCMLGSASNLCRDCASWQGK